MSNDKAIKIFADAAYDSKNNFSYLYHNDIVLVNQGKKELVWQIKRLLPKKAICNIPSVKLSVLKG